MANLPYMSECCAVILQFVQAVVLLVYLFTSINADIFLRASIQVGGASKGTPFSPWSRRAEPRSNEDGLARAATPRKRNQELGDIRAADLPRNISQETPKESQTLRSPDQVEDQTVFSQSKPEPIPSYSSILRIHEDIMASDAETIRIQQATIESQQEIIRSQKEMVHQLLRLLEVQSS